MEFNGKRPQIASNAFVAPTATIIGDVTVGEGASIWFGAVLRGDFGRIEVGKNTSVQDNVVVHVLPESETVIGENVTIAHGAVIHNCTIQNKAVIGMNVVVLDFADVGEQAMVAAGSVIPDKFKLPARHLAAGVPAQIKKEIDGNSLWWIDLSSQSYQELARKYLQEQNDNNSQPK